MRPKRRRQQGAGARSAAGTEERRSSALPSNRALAVCIAGRMLGEPLNNIRHVLLKLTRY